MGLKVAIETSIAKHNIAHLYFKAKPVLDGILSCDKNGSLTRKYIIDSRISSQPTN